MRVGAGRTHSLIIFERVGNSIAREGIGVDLLANQLGRARIVLVLQVDVRCLRLDGEDALVDIDDTVNERNLGIEAGLGDHAHRLTKPYHKRLVSLIHREKGAVGNNKCNQ